MEHECSKEPHREPAGGVERCSAAWLHNYAPVAFFFSSTALLGLSFVLGFGSGKAPAPEKPPGAQSEIALQSSGQHLSLTHTLVRLNMPGALPCKNPPSNFIQSFLVDFFHLHKISLSGLLRLSSCHIFIFSFFFFDFEDEELLLFLLLHFL